MFGQLLPALLCAVVRVRSAVRAATAQAHGDLLRLAAHRALQASARLNAAGRILTVKRTRLSQAYADTINCCITCIEDGCMGTLLV